MVVRQAAVSECGPPRGRRRASFPQQHPVGDDQAFKPDSPEPYIARDASATNTARRSDLIVPMRRTMILPPSLAHGSSLHMAINGGPCRARLKQERDQRLISCNCET